MVVAAFNQEKALVGAFSVITNLRMELFEALVVMGEWSEGMAEPAEVVWCGDLFILLTSHCPATVATVWLVITNIHNKSYWFLLFPLLLPTDI